jgi:hypothetical protein
VLYVALAGVTAGIFVCLFLREIAPTPSKRAADVDSGARCRGTGGPIA